MILNKVYDTTAKWDKDNNKWDIAERLKYQWNDMKNKPVSPEYEDIDQALDWIKAYDSEHKVSTHEEQQEWLKTVRKTEY
jgi:hypothetical protein